MVMTDPGTFTVQDPRFSTSRVIGPSMLSLDGPEHARHRAPFVDPFRSDPVRKRLGDWIQQRATQLVEEMEPRGEGDLRASLAGPLAVDVMSRVLDLQGVTVAELLAWYRDIVDAVETVTVGGDVPEAGRRAFDALHAAVEKSITTSDLLRSVKGSLNVEEIVSNVAVLLFGGVVTSESTTANVFAHLLDDPRLLDLVQRDPSLVAPAVEESMRLEPAAAAVDRYATRDVDLGPASIRRGELVRVSLSAANRDPATYPDPHRFDLHRSNASSHLSFARGPHACLGVHVARLESRAALTAANEHLRDLRRGPEGIEPARGLIFRVPRTVTARWG